MFTCVVTDYVEPDLNWEKNQYDEAGISFHAFQLRKAGPSEIVKAAAEADVLVVDQAKIPREVISQLSRCKLIIRHGDGYDNLDTAAATEHGIVCANKPGFWSREVAELSFTLSLALFLKLGEQQKVAAAPLPGGKGWELTKAMPQRRLANQTVGVIGFGKIGRTAADLFKGVCDTVLVHDPFIDDGIIAGQGHTPVNEEKLLKDSDLITIHIPATEKTTGYFNAERFASMKKEALVVNTSRGSLIRTEALVEAIRSGQLGGAALDVTDPEPLSADHPLFTLPNVIITPHMGWYSEDALWNMRRSIVEDVKTAAAGNTPETVVNPEVLESSLLRF